MLQKEPGLFSKRFRKLTYLYVIIMITLIIVGLFVGLLGTILFPRPDCELIYAYNNCLSGHGTLGKLLDNGGFVLMVGSPLITALIIYLIQRRYQNHSKVNQGKSK